MMAGIAFTEVMAEHILAADMGSIRFEKLRVELFSELDGVDYVPTSASWDLGRDGRPITLRTGDYNAFIACSLKPDVPEKALEDLDRLSENGPVKALRFCSSQRLSEHAREKITKQLRDRCPSLVEVAVDGALQICTLLVRDERYSKILERFYTTELESLREALATPTGEAEKAHITGMRIALTTQLSKGGDILRADVVGNLILTALSDKKSKSKNAIAKHVSEQLHLGRIVHDLYLFPSLKQLEKGKFIITSGQVYSITEKGQKALIDLTNRGTKVLLEGQRLVRNAIEELIGRELTEEDFSKVWKLLQDELAEMFFQNGMQIIEAIGSIAQDDAQVKDFKDLSDAISELGRKVERILLGGPFAQDIGQALVDVFHDKGLPTFEWLTNLCVIYVTLCSLGLEPGAQRAVFGRLRNLDLLLDTDIVLSLLSEGEPDHATIDAVVKGWRRIGGSLCVATPVLEEVAYHASISENDFQEVYHQLSKYSESDARRLITNAFVRGYWATGHERSRKYSYKTWRQYINNFRGAHETDYSKILEELGDLGLQPISDEVVDESLNLATGISDDIVTELRKGVLAAGRYLSKQVIDKSKRDGRLIVILIQYRKNRRESGGTGAVVSSSSLLKQVCKNRKDLVGPAEAVMPLGAIAYLLALAPRAQMSVISLKKLLFTPGMTERLTSLQRTALRIIYDSTEFSLPFSRRFALQREMYSKMTRIAVEQGQPVSDLIKEIETKGADREELLKEVVYEAIDRIAWSQSERRVQELENEVRRLQEELAKSRKRK